jgi:CRISPR system Cascade subunit CasA
MLSYWIDEKHGKLPIQFRERGLWRDFDSLLPDGGNLAPGVIEHATALTRFDRSRFPRSAMVLGLSNTKAKIEFWRLERFALPNALLGERSIRSEIHQLLIDAEEGHVSLSRACQNFARDVLSRGDRDPDTKDINRFVEQMPVEADYWSALEIAFHEVLRDYTPETDPDAIRLGWLKTVRATLAHAWQRHAASVATRDAWAIRALVRSETGIGRKLGSLNEEIRRYEAYRQPQEGSA